MARHVRQVVSCADFFVYSGWDRGQKRVLGTMRTEVVLKTASGLAEFLKELGPATAELNPANPDVIV